MSQYVYFSLSSEVVTAAEMIARLGMSPDKVVIRGSRATMPRPVPADHSWQVHSLNQAAPIDDQIKEVLDRLRLVDDQLRHLVTADDVQAQLNVVRYFNDETGYDELFEDTVTENGEVLQHIGGQHQMLGWYLAPEQLGYLASIRAAISADEYG